MSNKRSINIQVFSSLEGDLEEPEQNQSLPENWFLLLVHKITSIVRDAPQKRSELPCKARAWVPGTFRQRLDNSLFLQLSLEGGLRGSDVPGHPGVSKNNQREGIGGKKKPFLFS